MKTSHIVLIVVVAVLLLIGVIYWKNKKLIKKADASTVAVPKASNPATTTSATANQAN